MNQKVEFLNNLDDHIKIHLSASKWRQKNCSIYSEVWDPEIYCRETYLKEFYETQAFVMYIDADPVAAVVLYAEGEAKYSKKANEKVNNAAKILYVDDLATKEEHIGSGVINKLLKEIVNYAKSLGFSTLRLDTDKRLECLINCYIRNGFQVVSEDHDEHENRTSVFLERYL